MARFEVLIKPSAAKELAAIPQKKIRRLIVRRIEKLAEDPRATGCRKLSGRSLYRIRQGDYRVVYEIRDNRLIVLMVKIGNRDSVYRRLR